MRLLWLESRLVRLRGQVYIFWHVLPVLEVKERWRDKPWWCEHFSGVSGNLCSPADRCSSPFFLPWNTFPSYCHGRGSPFQRLLLSSVGFEEGSQWAAPVVWGGRSISSLLLCNSLGFAAQMGSGTGRVSIPIPAGFIPRALPWDSSPHIPFQVCWVRKSNLCLPLVLQTDKIHNPSWAPSAGSGIFHGKNPWDSSCLALPRFCFQLNPKTHTRLWWGPL